MFIIVLIAISLSMDAFSLSLAYGTLGLKKGEIITLSIIVGIFHFIMPLLGMVIGENILHIVSLKSDLLISILLFIVGFEMIKESLQKDNEQHIMNLKEMILFGFTVSVDSFSVGIGLNSLNYNYYLCSLLFSISSFIFTYLGSYLGKKLYQKFSRKASIFGGILLIIIGFSYLLS